MQKERLAEETSRLFSHLLNSQRCNSTALCASDEVCSRSSESSPGTLSPFVLQASHIRGVNLLRNQLFLIEQPRHERLLSVGCRFNVPLPSRFRSSVARQEHSKPESKQREKGCGNHERAIAERDLNSRIRSHSKKVIEHNAGSSAAFCNLFSWHFDSHFQDKGKNIASLANSAMEPNPLTLEFTLGSYTRGCNAAFDVTSPG